MRYSLLILWIGLTACASNATRGPAQHGVNKVQREDAAAAIPDVFVRARQGRLMTQTLVFSPATLACVRHEPSPNQMSVTLRGQLGSDQRLTLESTDGASEALAQCLQRAIAGVRALEPTDVDRFEFQIRGGSPEPRTKGWFKLDFRPSPLKKFE